MIIGESGIGSIGVGESYVVTDESYSLDLLIGLPANGYYAMDTLIFKTLNKTYTMDEVSKSVNTVAIPFSAYFLNAVIGFDVSMRVISDYRNRVPTDSIINTLYHSWATELDHSYRDIVTASKSTNVHRADSTYLDIIGEVFHTRRLVGELDEPYRKRLVTQTSVLLGHGTKAVCEAIVDRIIGVPGCKINTGAPGYVKIEFDNNDAMRAAKSLKTTIETVAPDMFAAGIFWTLDTPIIDYTIDGLFRGAVDCPYTMDVLNQTDRTKTYSMDVVEVFQRTKSITIDSLIQNSASEEYLTDIHLQKMISKTISINELVQKSFVETYSMDVLGLKYNVQKTYTIDELIQKFVNKSIPIDSLIMKARTSRYSMSTEVIA